MDALRLFGGWLCGRVFVCIGLRLRNGPRAGPIYIYIYMCVCCMYT